MLVDNTTTQQHKSLSEVTDIPISCVTTSESHSDIAIQHVQMLSNTTNKINYSTSESVNDKDLFIFYIQRSLIRSICVLMMRSRKANSILKSL